MIAFITFKSSLVPLFEGLWSSNSWEFEVLGFRRNRTDDLGIDSPSLWPTEPRLHVRSYLYRLCGSFGLDTFGRAASGGPLSPEPPRATRSQPESLRILYQKTDFVPKNPGTNFLSPTKQKTWHALYEKTWKPTFIYNSTELYFSLNYNEFHQIDTNDLASTHATLFSEFKLSFLWGTQERDDSLKKQKILHLLRVVLLLSHY